MPSPRTIVKKGGASGVEAASGFCARLLATQVSSLLQLREGRHHPSTAAWSDPHSVAASVVRSSMYTWRVIASAMRREGRDLCGCANLSGRPGHVTGDTRGRFLSDRPPTLATKLQQPLGAIPPRPGQQHSDSGNGPVSCQALEKDVDGRAAGVHSGLDRVRLAPAEGGNEVATPHRSGDDSADLPMS